MNLTFVDDGPLYFDKNGQYYEYAFHGLYERYHYMADNITFLIRTSPVTDKTGGTLLCEEINVVDIPNYKSPKNYVKNKKKASTIIDKEIQKSDIVILRGSVCAHLALNYVKKYKKPYIYECVACDWDKYWNYSLLGKFVAPYMYVRSKLAIRNAKYVYYVTQKYLQKKYPTRGMSVACSNVVLEKNNKDVIGKRLNKIEKNFPYKKIILGTASAIDVKYKGQEYVIKAISILNTMGYEIEYYLAGDNRSNSTYLQDIAIKYNVKKKVVFCGSLSSKQMQDFYDFIDIYVHPSKLEGLSRSIIEAMSRGCPVIATNVGGASELLKKEYLFKSGSVSEVVRALERLLKNDVRKVAISNFIKSNKEYNVKYLSEKRKKFYDMFLLKNKIYKNEL